LIEDVYVVPNIVRSLLSVKALRRKGIVTVFAEKEVVFKKGNSTVISGELGNQLYVVVFEEEKQANVMQMNEALVWHRHFAHCSGEKLRVLKGIYPELLRDLSLTFDCKDCSRANMRQKEFKSMKESYPTIDTCSADLCRPLQALSLGGARYFPIMVDMDSCFTHIGFLRNKEAKEILEKLLF
jgi:hypothetical protein